MRAAVKDTVGLVVNVIEYDPEGDYTPDDGLTVEALADGSPVGPGWQFTKAGAVAPVPEVEEMDPVVAQLEDEQGRTTVRTDSERDALLNLLVDAVLASK